MRTALALTLCSSLALAQPTDTPTHPEGRSIPLNQGDMAPFGGQLIDPTEMVRREKVNERNVGELLKLKEDRGAAIVPVPVVVAVVASALAVGIAVGVGTTLAAKR